MDACITLKFSSYDQCLNMGEGKLTSQLSRINSNLALVLSQKLPYTFKS